MFGIGTQEIILIVLVVLLFLVCKSCVKYTAMATADILHEEKKYICSKKCIDTISFWQNECR